MTWNQVLLGLINTAFKIVISLCIPYLFALLRSKIKGDRQAKYLIMAEQIIRDAVVQVQQTYVSNLKAENLFDAEAQAYAFNLAKEAALNMMSEKLKNVVQEIVGDFEAYLNNKIEASVYDEKRGLSYLAQAA